MSVSNNLRIPSNPLSPLQQRAKIPQTTDFSKRKFHKFAKHKNQYLYLKQ